MDCFLSTSRLLTDEQPLTDSGIMGARPRSMFPEKRGGCAVLLSKRQRDCAKKRMSKTEQIADYAGAMLL
jgi:hypothetical protein